MVDGVLGCVDDVVSHVVVEHNSVLEAAVILHLVVEERVVLAQVLSQDFVQIKTHGSELQGQEEAACMHVFWPMRPLQ